MLKGMRYERKFIVNRISVQGLEQVVLDHSSYFKEIYNQRYINNIYFDTHNLSHYYDNNIGRSQRKKVRIRWYGDFFGKIEKPVLEIKKKDGLLGTKLSFRLDQLDLKKYDLYTAIKASTERSDLPQNIHEEIRVLKPTLLNRYSRKYFLDFSKKYRMTIDSDIQYFNPLYKNSILRTCVTDHENYILELKYDHSENEDVSKITSKLPFRMTKNSKYVNGIELFNNVYI